MKPIRLLAAFLTLAVLMTSACALAGSKVEGYTSDYFTLSFGKGSWSDEGEFSSTSTIYTDVNANPFSAPYFVVDEREFEVDITDLDEEQITALYDELVPQFFSEDEAAYANMETITINGCEARIFSYKIKSFPAAACVLVRGKRLLILSYFSGSADDAKARKKVREAAETIQYLGE